VRWQLAVDERERSALTGLVADCPGTRISVIPAPVTAEPSLAPLPVGSECSPAYPSVCIPPPPPDLDCSDIPYRRFTVLPPDPDHFDGDGDGIGCEG
jgi:micrococcal nuclease